MGKAKNLKSRVSSYFTNLTRLGDKTAQLVAQIHTISVTVVDSEFEALLLEAFYIKKFHPKYNVIFTDDKAYLYIRITIHEKYPAILTSRKKDDAKSVYFGPFPSASSVRLVLRTLRRIFPFSSTLNHPKRICLYHHLDLCPCIPAFPSKIKEYERNITRIIRILEGKSPVVKRELKNEMDKLGRRERYEEAKEVKRQLDALQYVTQPFHMPLEYDTNPDLRVDIRAKELAGLSDALNKYGLGLKSLARIECYDISNISGVFATGSLVVLTHGEIDKSQYRRFRIRRENRPNDVAMMVEVFQRRLKRSDWPLPDLIIVDGGKGQVGAVTDVVKLAGKNIPVIGLAKREETIVIANSKSEYRNSKQYSGEARSRFARQNTNEQNSKRFEHSSFENSNLFRASDFGIRKFFEVSLPKDSSALHLIQRIRDEAHRFAVTYHRKLRSKAISG